MKCPIDGTQLVMADRSGVEIDYCPQCRGVWLDRGELDKIIERSVPQPQQSYVEEDRRRHDDDDDYDRRGYDQPRGRKKKRMSSFLDEIFDF